MSTFRNVMFAAVLGAVPFAAGCEAEEPGETTPIDPDAATYYADIKPVLDARCASCHREGGIAPFSLESFADVEDKLGAIRSAVENKTMPPWPAEADCNDYKNDRSLTDSEIGAIVGWIDDGAPAGDPSSVPGPGPSEPKLSRVDVSLSMQAEYTPHLEPDDYRCFLLDWPEDATKYVTGFRANPGNAATVHHVIAYLVPPNAVEKYQALDDEDDEAGYTCFGGPGGGVDQDTAFVGSWAPGSEGGDFPAGTGIKIEPGSKIALQVHYNTLNAGRVPDKSSIDVRIDDSVEHEAAWQFFTNLEWVFGSGMDIPAMTQDVTHEYALDPTAFVSGGDPILIHAVGLHMHTLGQTARLSIERAKPAEECLLDIPAWDFHWQGSYELDEAVELQQGDKLSISCTWDNPTPNTIQWGEGTEDEMCLGLIYYTLK